MPAVEEEIALIKSYGVDAHFFNVNAADPNRRADVLTQLEEIFKGKKNPIHKSNGSLACIRNSEKIYRYRFNICR